jgi:hypothetical protein
VPNTTPEDLIDSREVSALLGVAPATLEYWRWKGVGPRHRIVDTRAVRYLRADVIAYRDRDVRDCDQRQLAA